MIIHFSLLAIILLCCLVWGSGESDWIIENRLKGKRVIGSLAPYVLIFGYITFIAAMRTNVNDSGVYRRDFLMVTSSLSAISEELSNFNIQYSFSRIIVILFKHFVSTNYHVYFGVYAAVESIIIVHVLREESVSFFDTAYYLFASSLYVNYLTMMRQWAAVVLVFSGIHALAEQRPLEFVVHCAIAGLFHPSAFLMIPVYFLVQGKSWSLKQFIIIVTFGLLVVYMNPILSSMGELLDGSTYDYMIIKMQTSTGSSWIRIMIAAVPVVLSYLYGREDNDPVANICTNMALISLLLTILATFTSGLYVIRFTTYFTIFNLILYPYLLNVSIKDDEQIKGIIKPLFYILFFALYFYSMRHVNGFRYTSDVLGTFN